MTTQSHHTALYINISSSNVLATIVSSIATLTFDNITSIIGLVIFTRPQVVVAGV
jgi:hypothetical protein